jgi:FUS-interacting serine-arginine-rich protein 1
MAKNLPRDITVEKLRSVFEVYGPLRDVYIPKNMDKSSPYFGTIKGFAKVMFLKPEDSAKAYQAQLNRLTIGANKIVIEFAKEDR